MNPATPSSSKTVTTPPTKKRRIESATTPKKGCTILLTGLAKSGKTSLSDRLTQFLESKDVPVQQLDGKKLRSGLCSQLAFDKPEDRSAFVHLSSECAKLFTEKGFITLLSIVAPLTKDRESARESHNKDNLPFLEIFVDRPRDECDKDTGAFRNVFYPIDADYENPSNPDIHLSVKGKDVNAMIREIVETLVANAIISQQLLMPPPPPLLLDSSISSIDNDDDDMDIDEDADNDNAPFKLPLKNSLLRAIYDYLLNEIKSRPGGSNVPENLNHPVFFEIMTEWQTWFNEKVGEERFYPVKIPVPPTKTTPKKSTPSKSPKTPTTPPVQHQWWNYIPVQWTGETIKYDQNPRKKTLLDFGKCLKCWQKGSRLYCRMHNGSKNLVAFGICQDANEQTIKYGVMIQYDAGVNKVEIAGLFNHERFKRNLLLQSYMTSHPQHNFIPLYETSISFGSELKLPIFHTATLSTSLIVMLRNQEILETQAQILPHQLLNLRIDMKCVNFDVLDETLEENGITFTVGEDYEEPPLLSPMASTYCDKLPRVYYGMETGNKLNIGLKYARIGTTMHSDFTHGEGYESDVLYQTPLTSEQVTLGNSININLGKESWTDEQKALHKLVEEDCRRKESLGIAVLPILSMKKQVHKGILIVPHNKFAQHDNTTEAGDREYMEQVFKFLSGRSLTVTVNPSTNLSFMNEFFPQTDS